MDINKLALELQQNQSVRQKIYAQYMNNQDDFFFQNFHGILEEKVLFEYLQHAQKHKKLMKLLPAILCFSTQTTLSARVIRKIQRLPISARRNCVFSLAHCELSVFKLAFCSQLCKKWNYSASFWTICSERNLFTCRCSAACRLRKRHQQIGDSGRACAD